MPTSLVIYYRLVGWIMLYQLFKTYSKDHMLDSHIALLHKSYSTEVIFPEKCIDMTKLARITQTVLLYDAGVYGWWGGGVRLLLGYWPWWRIKDAWLAHANYVISGYVPLQDRNAARTEYKMVANARCTHKVYNNQGDQQSIPAKYWP